MGIPKGNNNMPVIKKPELLAPVGGRPHLIAAVNSGADAVYMGGMGFNARIFADNFSDEELPDAINYAHAHGVRVYMTINTLVSDAELGRAFRYCNYLYGIGADGVIIQDMGLARLLRLYLPDFPLHMSTQCTIYNAEAVSLAAEMGFSRIVPARELSLGEIKEMTAACVALTTPMDIEVFVHGSLCMCYSGQCQMSRMLGGGSGRSGNRGTCAQPCRHPYTDEKGRTYYALSPKDLCLIDDIPELVQSGAASFKIEGRIKSPEYVAVVTGIYRKYIDLYAELAGRYGADEAAGLYRVDEADMLDLRQIFNRGDFTEGYLHGNPGRELLSGVSPKNQGLYLGRIAAVIDNENKAGSRDEKTAVRGALRRGKVLVCIEKRGAGDGHDADLGLSDGVEFRNEDSDHPAASPAGGVVTYIKDLGHGHILAGDFDRGAEAGDMAYKVTDRKLMERALDLPERKLPVTMSFTARAGQFPELVMTDVKLGQSFSVTADHVVERARRSATDKERIEGNLRRLGNTPYDPGLTGIDIEIDEDIMMPVSVINRMRREASEELLSMRLGAVVSGRRPKLTAEEAETVLSAESCGGQDSNGESYGEPHGETYIESLKDGIERKGIRPVSLTEFMKNAAKSAERSGNSNEREAAGSETGASEGHGKTVPYILNVSKGELDRYIRENFDDIARACRDTGILIGNMGWIKQFRDAGVRVYGDYGLNIYNSQAGRAFEEAGVTVYMPSHETGASDGRGIPLMITEHPVDAEVLTDRKGKKHGILNNSFGDKTLIF